MKNRYVSQKKGLGLVKPQKIWKPIDCLKKVKRDIYLDEITFERENKKENRI